MDQGNERDTVYSRPLTELLSNLLNDVTTLIRQELALAKAELSEKISRATSDALTLIVGGVIAFTGVLTLVAAAVLALALILPAWASALIIGGVIALIGLVFVMRGLRDIKRINPVPEKTVESVKEDAKMIEGKFK